MAIAINGSGTITGITAGGLPDDVITTADIADDAITTAKILNLNVTTAKIATGIDSAKIGAGDVSNTEHAYLNSVSSNVQTQISAAGGTTGWHLLQTTVCSNTAQVDYTGIDSTYETYVMTWTDAVPDTDTVNPLCRLGDSGGFDVAGSDYRYHTAQSAASSGSYAAVDSTGASSIRLGATAGSAAGEGTSGHIFLHVGNNTTWPILEGTYTVINESSAMKGGSIHAVRAAVITVTGMRFFFSGGTIASGRISFYGVAHA